MENTNHSKEVIKLLKELDDLIQRDYETALRMLQEFRRGTFEKQEEVLYNPNIFSKKRSEKELCLE